MSEPRTPGSGALVRLVAAREISTRLRDRAFLVGTGVILLLVLGAMVFQVIVASGASEEKIGVVGDRTTLEPALTAQGVAIGVDVTVVPIADEAAARTALENADVDGVLVDGTGSDPRLLVEQSADGQLQACRARSPS